MNRSEPRLISVFTPSYADANNTNAQNLTVKEIVARLPEDEFHVTMLCEGQADARLQARKNTRLVEWMNHGNTARLLWHCLLPPVDVYFFPRTGPLDRIFFDVRKRAGVRTALVTYIVMAMNETTGEGMIGRSIREGDAIFGNSKYVSETVRQQFGVSARTIYDGIDKRYYFPPQARLDDGVRTVLYAGSFQPRKRVEMLIHEAARLPGVKFRLAGKGETEKHCRDLAQQLGCSNVTFLGHLSSESLGWEMRRADIFLFPSILEGNPQVLLQASACGLPSVAMDLYRTDFVIDGKTGFLARSKVELSHCLDRLLADSNLQRSFSAAAAEHAAQFDWDDIARQWGSIFLEAAAKRHPQYQQEAS